MNLCTSAIFIALLLCTSSGSVDAKKKGKKSSKHSASSRNGKSSGNKGRSSNSRRSYVAAPTYAPVMNAGLKPVTDTPTFAPVLGTATKEPTFNIPVSESWYSFETPDGLMPVMNAETEAPAGEVPVDGTEAPTGEVPVDETKAPAGELPVDETSPTLAPILNAETVSPRPTQIPTFAPTLYPTSMYFFTTPGGVETPTLDAQTIASTTSTPSTAATTSSSKATTSTPSASTTTTSTDLPSAPSASTTTSTGLPSTPSASTPTTSTSLPSASPVSLPGTLTTIPSDTSNSTGTNTTIGTNETELCSSTSGVFFYTGEDNGTEPFKLDVFTFAYELETFPRVSAEDVLPSLEVAFVDSLLSVLFPSQCGGESSRRFLTSSNVVGISAEPADEATGAECEPELREKNRCEFIQGKLSIFTTDGNTDAVMEEIEEALSESMDDGVFNDPTSGIARVGYSVDEIPDEGTEGDRIEDTEGNNTVKPAANESGSMLGIGLSLSFAGVLLFVVGATAYRRKKKVGDNDASTLQDGVTVSGLNRFDAPGTEDSYMEGNGEIKVVPLSPAARSLVENNRYSAISNSDTAQE